MNNNVHKLPWDVSARGPDVRFGSKADTCSAQADVLLSANSGHSATLDNLINSPSDHTRHQTSGQHAYV